MKKILIAAAVAVLGATAASAADLPVYKKAPPAAVYSWTGFYAGLNIGYGWEDPKVGFASTEGFGALIIGTPANPLTSFDTSGVAGGAQVGYNYQFDQRWVAGIEADFSGSGINGQGSAALTLVPTGFARPGTANASEDVKWFGTVRGRLGYLATPTLLVFGTGGFAYGKVDQSASILNNGIPTLTAGGGVTVSCATNANCYAGSSSRTATGWTAGGGFEYALMQNWTVKAEYLYVNLGSNAFGINPVTVAGGPSPGPVNVSFSDTHFNLVRVGANYRF